MNRDKTKQSTEEIILLFTSRISSLNNDLNEGRKYLSDSLLLRIHEDMASCEEEFNEINDSPMLESVKLRKLSSLYSRIGVHYDSINESKIKHESLLDVFEGAEKSLNISDKYSMRWSLIESEYKLGQEAIKFRNDDLFKIIYTNLQDHIHQLQEQIIIDKERNETIAKRLISEIMCIVDDELSEYVLDESTLEFLVESYEDISTSKDGETILIGNIGDLSQQVEDSNRILSVRKNQINILVAIDKIIQDRLSISDNPFFKIVRGRKMKEIDNYDDYFERSIRAINR